MKIGNKLNKLTIMKKLLLLIVPAMMLFACNNAETKTEKTEDCCGKEECCDKEKKCDDICKDDVMTVDALTADLESNVDKEITICGTCTHICDHSGKNIFINSFDDEEVLIIGKAGEDMEPFDKELEGKNIVVKGVLRAQEVEEGEEIEVHHDIEINYYIEVVKVQACVCDKKCTKATDKKCCGGEKEGCEGHKKEGCDGKKHEGHDHKGCEGHDHE